MQGSQIYRRFTASLRAKSKQKGDLPVAFLFAAV